MPFFEPLAAAVKSKTRDGIVSSVARSLIALAEGRWCTQADLMRAGLADTDICAACRSEVGDLPHRVLTCAASDDIRARWDEKGQLTNASSRRGEPLYVRGVAERPPLPRPPELQVRYAHVPGEGDTPFSGCVFLDGSVRNSSRPLARRGVWAAVMTEVHGNMKKVVYGTSDDQFPTIFRAGLRAAVMALKEVAGPIILFSDNAQVISEWQRGEAWCTDGRRTGADLWRQFWFTANELGCVIRFVKVKAHLTEIDVARGRISEAMWKGNLQADRYAKEGAAMAERDSPVVGILKAYDEAEWSYSAACQIMARWPDDVERNEERGRVKLDEKKKRSGRDAHSEHPHEIWKLGGQTICRKCGRSAVGLVPQRVLKASPCQGTSASRLVAAAGAQRGGIKVQDTDAYTEEDLLGRGAVLIRAATGDGADVERAGQRHEDSAPGGTQPTHPPPSQWRLPAREGAEAPSEPDPVAPRGGHAAGSIEGCGADVSGTQAAAADNAPSAHEEGTQCPEAVPSAVSGAVCGGPGDEDQNIGGDGSTQMEAAHPDPLPVDASDARRLRPRRPQPDGRERAVRRRITGKQTSSASASSATKRRNHGEGRYSSGLATGPGIDAQTAEDEDGGMRGEGRGSGRGGAAQPEKEPSAASGAAGVAPSPPAMLFRGRNARRWMRDPSGLVKGSTASGSGVLGTKTTRAARGAAPDEESRANSVHARRRIRKKTAAANTPRQKHAKALNSILSTWKMLTGPWTRKRMKKSPAWPMWHQ